MNDYFSENIKRYVISTSHKTLEGNMKTMDTWEILALSFVGAILPDAIRIIKNKFSNTIPEYLSYGNFWLSLILMILVGMIANFIFIPGSPKEAIAVAFGGPEILTKAFAKAEKPESGKPGADKPAGTKARFSVEADKPVKEKKRVSLLEWWSY